MTHLLFALSLLAQAGDAPLLHARADALSLVWPLQRVSILVDKSDRQLTLYSGDTIVRTYAVELSRASEGDKVRQGDMKTPVGTFRVVTRNPNSHFTLFLGLSYPTTEDAERGLKAGWITEAQAKAIREADTAGRVPPWDTQLGGAIGVHGMGGSGAEWTLGCVAVTDDVIRELWEVVPYGTKVTIRE